MTRLSSTIRRAVLAVAMAGAATFGAVALAPAASAAEPAADGSVHVIDGNGHGPEAFLVTEHGRQPVFFCTDEKNNKRHGLCQEAAPEEF